MQFIDRRFFTGSAVLILSILCGLVYHILADLSIPQSAYLGIVGKTGLQEGGRAAVLDNCPQCYDRMTRHNVHIL